MNIRTQLIWKHVRLTASACRLPVVVTALIVVLLAQPGSVHAAKQNTAALDRLAAVLPKQMRAAVLVANLDRSSDSLVTLLEGMDRANLLIGSRPSDQIKSTLQLSVAVDDLGGGGVVFVPGESANEENVERHSKEVSQTLIAVGVVPVTSVKQFLSGNFAVSEDDLNGIADDLVNGSQSFMHPLMGAMHVRRINNHVILSRHRQAVATYEPVGQARDVEQRSATHLRDHFGANAWQTLAEGHLFVYSEQDSVRVLLRQARRMIEKNEGTADAGLLLSLLRLVERKSDSPMLASLTEAGRDGAIVFRFDPLGLFVRTHWNLDSQCPLAQRAKAGAPSMASVSPLPAHSYFLAGSFDAPMVFTMLPSVEPPARVIGSLTNVRRALRETRRLHVLASPHPAGFGEGFAANTAVVIETDKPSAVREAIERDLQALGDESPDRALDVNWQRDVSVNGDTRADAFRVEINDRNMKRTWQRVAQQYLFGPGNVSGYVWSNKNVVIVTTTRHKQTLLNAIQAWRGQGETLGADPVVTTMRNWMPAQRAVELYIQPDEVLRALRHTPLGFAMPQPLRARLNSDLTPIGFSARVSDSQARTITIIPADTLTLALDTIRRPPGAGVSKQQQSTQSK